MSEPIYIDIQTGVEYVRNKDGILKLIPNKTKYVEQKTNKKSSGDLKQEFTIDVPKIRSEQTKNKRSIVRSQIIHTHNREVSWKDHEIHLSKVRNVKYVVVDGFMMSDVIDTIVTDYNDQFSINGQKVTLVEGTYTPDKLAAMIQGSIYAVSSLVSLGMVVTTHPVSKKLVFSAGSSFILSFPKDRTSAHVMGFLPETSTDAGTSSTAPFKVDVSSITLLNVTIAPGCAIGRNHTSLGSIPCTPMTDGGGNRPFHMDMRTIPDSQMYGEVIMPRLSMIITDAHENFFPINRYRYTVVLSVFHHREIQYKN